MTDEEARPGGHIRYALVNLAVQTRPWQSGSIYLTRVENQTLCFLSILSSHLSPPSPSIFWDYSVPLELSARNHKVVRREEDVTAKRKQK